MRDGLTSGGLAKEKVARDQNSAPRARAIPRIMLFGFIGSVIIATAALWWRFGEGVFATSVMNAILACF